MTERERERENKWLREPMREIANYLERANDREPVTERANDLESQWLRKQMT